MKHKNFITIAISLIVLSLCSQIYLLRLDRIANEKFAEKAIELELKGKNEEFVINNFGKPSYKYISDLDNSIIWVYTPGPKFVFWPHECKIGFNKDGNVDVWVIKSD